LKLLGRHVALSLMRARIFEELHAEIDGLKVDRSESIRAARQARERELLRDFQAGLLPARLPSLAGVQFAAAHRPAPDAGADLYDVIDLGNGRLGLLVADVAGRGWPAVNAMSALHTLLQAEAQRTDSPREVLKAVHQALLASDPRETLVTVFYGIYDVAARRLAYCRAGHARPLWLRSDGHTVLLNAPGEPLGLLDPEELDLAEAEIFFSPGDTLLLYTNGLVDAVDPHGAEFGLDYWVNRAKEHSGLSPNRLCAALFDEVAEFQSGAAPIDDMTLLVMRIFDF
jgi:sigma-B regulation protein RsbU (phosphoserine phosphatase)